jgi:hypothetical protein
MSIRPNESPGRVRGSVGHAAAAAAGGSGTLHAPEGGLDELVVQCLKK